MRRSAHHSPKPPARISNHPSLRRRTSRGVQVGLIETDRGADARIGQVEHVESIDLHSTDAAKELEGVNTVVNEVA
jgi:hypothetical protein